MLRFVIASVLGLMSAFVMFAGAVKAGDLPESFPIRQTISGTDLVLNGYGVRERLFLDVYGCALYAPRKSSSSDYLMAPTTPTAIRIRVDLTPPADPPARWEETFRNALNPALYARLVRTYETLAAGDTLLFTYSPKSGTSAYLNNRHVFTVAGHDLMRGLLDQWLGPYPVSAELRRDLLNELPPSL